MWRCAHLLNRYRRYGGSGGLGETSFMPTSPFLNELRNAIRLWHYSIRTETAYVGWARRFIRFHKLHHPANLNDQHVAAFLTYLAVERNVAVSTQNQTLNALVFMCRHGAKRPIGDITGAARAKQPLKLPMVLDRSEVGQLLRALDGSDRLMGALLYGSGLRIMETLRLRVQDIDFNYCCIHIHSGKGQKDRIVTLSEIEHRKF